MDTFECLAFYRGVSAKYPIDRPYIGVVRQDRQPKNSSIHFHKIADQWFEEKFGTRYRSAAIFVTSQSLSAAVYGASPNHVVRIVPISPYRYCWSPNISDLLFGATQLAEGTPKEIRQYLDDAQYREEGLRDAYLAGHEVMLSCKQYAALPKILLPDAEGQTEKKKALVLP